jgi:hypothetical protein
MVTKKPYPMVEFAIKPHAIQQEIFDYIDGKFLNPKGRRYRFFIVVCGRQWGKSFLAKYTLMRKAINEGKRCMWVAPSIPTARGHWNELVDLIIKSGIPVKKLSQSAKEIHFHSGGSISVRSALEPDNLRGATLDFIVLDEAAFFRDGDYVWDKVIQPMVTASGGTVLMVTTPNGKNWLYNVWKKGQDENNLYYKSWQAPSTSSPYQDKELLEELRKSLPEFSWRQEYLAEFLSDAGGVFNGVDKAAVVNLLTRPLEGHTYVAGVDIGGATGDAHTFTVIDKYTREQVFGDAWVSLGTIQSFKRIAEHLAIWKPEVTMFEKNGVGETFFDILQMVVAGKEPDPFYIAQMQLANIEVEAVNIAMDIAIGDPTNIYRPKERLIGGHRIRSVHMNNDYKRAYVEGLSAAIEWGKLTILNPQCDYGLEQISEMSTYAREFTKSGNVTYNAQEGYHDDRVSSLYLAYHLLPSQISGVSFVNTKEHKEVNPFRSGKSLKRKKR